MKKTKYILCPYLKEFCDMNGIELEEHSWGDGTGESYNTKGLTEDQHKKMIPFLTDRNALIVKYNLNLNGL
jgi:hypothetical protein